MSDAQDIAWMSRALQLARRGIYNTDPNPNVGCVLVKDARCVGEGWHQRAGGPHAEIHALAEAKDKAEGATAYVTLEPCAHHGKTPPCCEALVAANVARVVVAMQDPNPHVSGKGLAYLQQAGIRVELGVLQAEAEALNPGFIKRMHTGLPWVQLKSAMSLDGRTAMASGESQWITGQAARADVQRFRGQSSAVVTGVGTVLADNPAMTVRDLGKAEVLRQPLRVVLDSQLQLLPTHRIVTEPGKVVVFTQNEAADKHQALHAAGVEVVVQDPRNLQAVLSWLAKHKETNTVWVEAGNRLAGSFLQAQLVDEWLVYMAPKLLGSQAQPLAFLPLSQMSQAYPLQVQEVRAVGEDIRYRMSINAR